MTSPSTSSKFLRFGTLLVLLATMIGIAPSPASAEPPTFTLVKPIDNQQVKLTSTSDWFLPVQVRGSAPGMDSLQFRAVLYDASGEAASITWFLGINQRIDTTVDWQFKLGLSNLSYVENPVNPKFYVPVDGKSSAQLVANRAPFKSGLLKPGTYAFQLFVTNLTNNTAEVAVGDIAGLKINTPAGVKCAPGSYSATGTWTSKTACTPASKGFLVSTAGAKTQSAAPAGAYTPRIGAASLFKCREGNYQPKAGQSSCLRATPGYFVAQVGATKQVKCAVGKFAPNSESFNCIPAQPGNKVPLEGSATQTKCAIGTYQPNFGKSFCTSAAPGYYVPDLESTSSIPCEPGTYQNETGKGNCKNATPGYYVFNQGSTMQFQCSLGTYSSFANSVNCEEAPTGFYVSTLGAVTPTACPIGKTTPGRRSVSVLECSIDTPSL